VSYRVGTENRANSNGIDGTVHVLSDEAGANRAEVWPALGFNCYRWQTTIAERPVEMLYASDKLFQNDRPTRSGIPILFPFPNRIRAGHFRWEGKDYQLPLNSDGKNAIHGFAAFRPWRVVDQGADGASAWVTGEFQAAVDARDTLALWPADYRLRVTIRLAAQRLRIEAQLRNPDTKDLPFGLGYHPYFRIEDPGSLVEAPAPGYWELEAGLPSGQKLPVNEARDLQRGRPYGELTLDDVYTGLDASDAGLRRLGSVKRGSLQLQLSASPDYRELVVFTPPHRQAVCLEPYTCVTDAVNLQAHGVDAGWRVLKPEEEWAASVEMGAGTGA